MRIISRKDNAYILCCDKGESWPGVFLDFCEEENIDGAFFYGLGGCIDPEIAYYDLEGAKEYKAKTYAGIYEVLNITGNIAVRRGLTQIAMRNNAGGKEQVRRKDSGQSASGELIVHAHVTLGKEDYGVVGGHLVSMTVGGTLELRVEAIDGNITRELDDETGLHLLSGN